jgi:hypothetical protein
MERLSSLRLDRSFVPLRDFETMRVESRRDFFGRRDIPGVAAALTVRAFHGPSELRYSALLFVTRAALETWDRWMRQTSPAWFSPLRSPAKNGLQESVLGGTIRYGLPHPWAAVVNRVVIIVGVYQNLPRSWRGTEQELLLLPDAVLAAHGAHVTAELIRRARVLSANR